MKKDLKDYIYDELLPRVEKPGRYVGTEMNSIQKNLEEIGIRFAFCFPDIYEIAMSHLGMKILYHILNKQKDIWCERVFAPWVDMEALMRKEGIKLFALESRDYIHKFDFVGFTLQYEMSYTNIINMLDLAGISILSHERGEEEPIVIAGGPCAYNPEPLAEVVDIFVLGDGEKVILELMEAYRLWKRHGGTRKDFLKCAASLDGIYIPSLYEVEYNEDDTIKAMEPIVDYVPRRIKKRIVKDLDKAEFPTKMIVPFINIVHDRIMLEIFRGCDRGCRFCQAGMVYRPVRERTVGKLMDIADGLVESTGYEEISLSSLSTGDYSELHELTGRLISKYEKDRISLSLPSLRIDSVSLELLKNVQKVRKSGLTFAPEAGTQRLRDAINKNVTERDLLDSVGVAFDSNYSTIKLYFMIGLPTETMEDIEGIAKLGHRVLDRYYETPKDKRGRAPKITISVSSFIPKPFTPFQWEPQEHTDILEVKQEFLQDLVRRRGLNLSWHEPKLSYLEAVFSRGDRKLNKVLIKAWELGCKFDGWEQHFKFDLWLEAFEHCGIDLDFYATRERDEDEILPWDHIDIGVTKEYLKREREKALESETTKFD